MGGQAGADKAAAFFYYPQPTRWLTLPVRGVCAFTPYVFCNEPLTIE